MKHNTFYKNLVWQYGLQILKHLFPLILVPYLTRVLGREVYAVYAYVLSFMGIAQTVADFGFTLSGTQSVVKKKNDKVALNALVGNITAARLMLCSLIAFAMTIASTFIPILRDNYFYVMTCVIAVAMRALLPDFIFQGYEDMGPLTTRYFASKGIQVALTLLLVHSGGDLINVALADIAGGAVGLAWSFYAMWHMFGISISRPVPSEALVELRKSAIYCVSNISSSLLSGFTTILIGLIFVDKTDLAYWSLTLTTVNGVQALYGPITNSLYPHMLNSRDFGFAKRICILAFPALLIGIAAYCILSKQIVLILGGVEYLGAANVMVSISPLLFFSFYAMLLGWPVLGAMGYVRELTATTVFSGVLNILMMTGIYVCGVATLSSVCLVRWIADAVLLASRCVSLFTVLHRREA